MSDKHTPGPWDFFMQQDYDNGKYTVIFDEKTGKMEALRHGEPWQDLSGNNLVYWMLVEHQRTLEQRAELLEALKLIANAENSALDLAYCKGIARAAIAKATGGAA